MRTVCILGTGEIGGAVAQAMAARHAASRLVLIDAAREIAAGKALDLQQAGAIAGNHTSIVGTDDWSRLAGCSACVLADRAGAEPEWRDDAARGAIERILAFAGRAPVVFAAATHASLLMAAYDAGIPRARLVGSAPAALAAAVTAMVAMEAGSSPADVMLTVLGAPPAGFVVPWSEASIGGYALERVLTQAQIARLEARAARLWPPGSHALGQAAARVSEAILRSSRRGFSVAAVLDGEFGVRGRTGIVPAQLWAAGIAHTRVPVLNPRERVRMEIALGS